MFNLLLYTLFCDKKENVAHDNNSFYTKPTEIKQKRSWGIALKDTEGHKQKIRQIGAKSMKSDLKALHVGYTLSPSIDEYSVCI